MNIVDPILYQCRHRPSAPAICCHGTKQSLISYGRLERFINNVGRQALAAGITRGSVVAIMVNDKIFHAALMLGLARIGVVTLSARHEKLPKEINVDVAISDMPRAFENAGRVIIADMTWTAGDGKPLADEQLYRTEPNDVCRDHADLGTTGDAKGVAFTHRMLIDRLQHYEVAKGPGFPYCSRLYCDLGLTTAAAFRYLLYMLCKGGTIFFYGDDPVSTIQSFDLYQVQAMIASPHALGEYLKFLEAHPEFHCSFEYVACAGGIVSKALSERIRSRLTANLVISYGSTEAGSVACAPAHLIADIPNAVGFVSPWITVEAVGESGEVLPPGATGVLRIRGPYNAAGYVGDPVELVKAFRDGWFYPGDVGNVTVDKVLVVQGRVDSVLNIGGDKVGPEAVEQVLAAFDGIEQAAVFSAPDRFGNGQLWAAVVAPAGFDREQLMAHCGRHLAIASVPIRIVAVPQILRNAWGKIDRPRLGELANQAESG